MATNFEEWELPSGTHVMDSCILHQHTSHLGKISLAEKAL